jgi:NAD(P)-dependent dehydrogenase (short-subunit alcohol dehydrogenase family)
MAALSGKKVLVIGGSSGIGFATAADISDQILLFLRNTFATGTVVYLDGGGLLV